MYLNPVNEEFLRAYANVWLLASDVWRFDPEVNDYKRANQHLWVCVNEVELRFASETLGDSHSTSAGETKVEKSQNNTPIYGQQPYKYFFHDVVCESPLFYYGDDEEGQYKDKESQRVAEFWTLPEVEQEFSYYTNEKPIRLLNPGQDIAPAKQMATVCPSQWLRRTKWPRKLLDSHPNLHLSFEDKNNLSLFMEDTYHPNYSNLELEEKLGEFPGPTYLIETSSDIELRSRIDCSAVRNLWVSPQPFYDFNLSADVPEFHPVSSRSLQYQSIYDASYEADLFPYMNMTASRWTPYHAQYEEEVNLPTLSNQPNLNCNNDYENTSTPWMISHSEGYRGRISLNTTFGTSSDGTAPKRVLNTQQTLEFLDKWLSKIYKPRSYDFKAISSTSHKFDTLLQNVHKNYLLSQKQARMRHDSSSKFEELEQEALKQYIDSDVTLEPQVLKRSSTEESCKKCCSPRKQPMWNKKKNKNNKNKQVKKKRSNKKPAIAHNYSELEVKLIDRLVNLKELFIQTFCVNHRAALLTDDISGSFNKCLKIIQECSEWFRIVIIESNQNIDTTTKNKRLDLAKNIVESEQEILGAVNGYIKYYSGLKRTLPFDSRLVFSIDQCSVIRKPMLSVFKGTITSPSSLSIENYFEIFSNRILINRSLLQRIVFYSPLSDSVKQEWQLVHLEALISSNTLSVEIKKENNSCYFVSRAPMSKLLRMVEDWSVWSTWQWLFSSGWKFTDNNGDFSFCWFNQFKAVSAEIAVSSVRNLIFEKWISEFKKLLLVEKNPRTVLIWDVENVNLVNSKVAFLTLVVKRGEDWVLSELCLNKYPCALWVPSSEHGCYFSWMSDGAWRNAKSVTKELCREVCLKPTGPKFHMKTINEQKKVVLQEVSKEKRCVSAKRDSLNQGSNCVLQ